ncbi:hypothetical protein DL93DRAFT_2167213 [Clavulina sp. PMI_390]|nr:hypothetical protein DL93DRAFT_2167213 [Clavulina sp. PMI_390]
MHASEQRALEELHDMPNFSILFSPKAYFIEIPCRWCPATLHEHSFGNKVGSQSLSIETDRSIIVVSKSKDRFFYVRPSEVADDESTPPDAPMRASSRSADIVLVRRPSMKSDASGCEARPAFSSLSAAYFLSISENVRLRVVPLRYAADRSHSTLPNSTISPRVTPNPPSALHAGGSGLLAPLIPHDFGHGNEDMELLCLSPDAGQVFYTEGKDCGLGYVHLWEWKLPGARTAD